MKKRLLFGVALICVSNICFSACLPESAKYEMRGNETYTAGFRRVTGALSDLAFFIHSPKTGLNYWFQFDMGNGYTDAYLLPIVEPKSGSQPHPTDEASKAPSTSFFSFDSKLNVKSEIVTTAIEAPAHIFLPQLGSNLYYFQSAFTNSSPIKEREILPRGLFELKSCD
ncbi:hypothetical protein [Burkholderia sp. LMU1-1-1.1]|uniref:hypothetical protein n=1 Tax=Burkholderia sp. LMU1-1-1.1 TaxID=3135266 RepID=UPI0034400184